MVNKSDYVVRCCVEHAAAVAKTFLISDAVVIDIPGPNKPYLGSHPGQQQNPKAYRTRELGAPNKEQYSLVTNLSITAFPNPIPWKFGSTTTSQIIALNTPSPVALAKATGRFVFSYWIHKSESVFSNAIWIFSVSRRGNPTATKTELRWSRLRSVIVLWRLNPFERRDSSEIERFVVVNGMGMGWI
uniref:Uncharacterized protein n=1 Tax=Solanum lycopersicum TaxID=4081 RepID=A0A3Q7GFX0_SOLLC